LQGNAKIFRRDMIAAIPLFLQAGTLVGKTFGEPLHDGRDQLVCILHSATRLVDESGLQGAPLAAELLEFHIGKERHGLRSRSRTVFRRRPIGRTLSVDRFLSDGLRLSIDVDIPPVDASRRGRVACQISGSQLPVFRSQLIHNVTMSLQDFLYSSSVPFRRHNGIRMARLGIGVAHFVSRYG
jgi:hypothetical protein